MGNGEIPSTKLYGHQYKVQQDNTRVPSSVYMDDFFQVVDFPKENKVFCDTEFYKTAKEFNLIQNPEKYEKVYNVVVLDSFSEKTIDIDGDGEYDMSHGDLVSRYITSNKGYKFNIIVRDRNEKLQAESFREIADMPDVDGVTLCFSANNANYFTQSCRRAKNKLEFVNSFDDDLSKLEINKNNLTDYKDFIFSDSKIMNQEKLEAFNNLVSSGKQIYAAAGNNRNKFSEFALFDGVIVVSNKDAKDEISELNQKIAILEQQNNNLSKSSRMEDLVQLEKNNKLIEMYKNKIESAAYDFSDYKEVDEHEQYVHRIKKIVDENGIPQGYDINDDGIPDIMPEETTSKGQGDGVKIDGTSFGTPVFLSKSLPNKIFGE